MKILKRGLNYLLVLSMIFSIVDTIPVTSHAEAIISIGDYVQMGSYYGEPILWRCVDIDENGPLMLSDKILCIKPFDAAGDNGSHTRSSYRSEYGSNYWADSNIRSWLNSNESAGNVEWLCGNPPIESKVDGGWNEYDQEAGFLTNFTLKEINAMKLVTQKSIVSYPESDNGIYDTGREIHAYNNSISSCVKNYDRAYAEYVTDRMFLLDVKQVNKVYQNSNVLGNNYYIGKPTQQCVQNSEYKHSSLNADSYRSYWLRSPYAYTMMAVSVMCIPAAMFTTSFYAYRYYIGVRPAFYLNLQSVIFKSGMGTENVPYIVASNDEIQEEKVYGYSTTRKLNVSGMELFIVDLTDVSEGSAVNFVCYKNGKLVHIESASYSGDTMYFIVNDKYDEAKVIVWDGFDKMEPMTIAECVK